MNLGPTGAVHEKILHFWVLFQGHVRSKAILWITSRVSTLIGVKDTVSIYILQARGQDFFWGVRSLERKGYFCQRFSVAVKSIYNQLRHDNSLLL